MAESDETSRKATVSNGDGDVEDSNADQINEQATGTETAGLADPTTPSLKQKIKQKLKKKAGDDENAGSKSTTKVTPKVVDELLALNPALKGELGGMDKAKAAEAIKKMDISELLTGVSPSTNNLQCCPRAISSGLG